jgi:Protein of unknown function (DUF1638)
MTDTAEGVVLVACRIMEPELEELRKDRHHIEIHYLDQSLHRTPQQMAGRIQSLIDETPGRAERIVLGYGLCSNGILGVQARQQEVIIPRCHDCISFFLGSPEAYRKDFDAHPGTYYLTPGWLAERKDPLGIIEDDYTRRVGRETAVWAMREELKHYTRIVLINTGIGDMEPLRIRARENAAFFNLHYEEIEGLDLAYFVKLMDGPYAEAEFLRLQPGEVVTQEMFIC